MNGTTTLPGGRGNRAAERLFDGGTQMDACCRALDWSATPLGAVQGWPESLRVAVRICLAARFPMAVLWGPERVMLYNDAHRAILGPKHPRALGRPAREVWTERWAEAGPRLAAILDGGPADGWEDQPVDVARAAVASPAADDGRLARGAGAPEGLDPEAATFAFSLSPIPDDAGGVGGVLAVVVETTDRVRAAALREREARQAFLLRLSDRLRPLADADAVQYEAACLLGAHLGASRVGYAEDQAEDGTIVVVRHYTDGVPGIDGRYRYDDYGPELLRALRAGHTVVRPDVANDPTLTPAERAAHDALQLGATVNVPLVKAGRLAAVLFMHHRRARAWTPDELTLLEDVAARTWEAVERARAEAALRASEEAARLRLAELEGARAEAEAARAETEAARIALVESESKFRFALAVADLGAWELDLVTQRAWRSLRHDQIFGYQTLLPEWTYERFLAHVVPEDRARVDAAYGGALAASAPWDFTCRIRRADGEERWISARGEPIFDAAGAPARLVGVVSDVTAEREAEAALRAAVETAEAANRAKSEFLAVMSHELRTPLNAIGGYAELLEMGIRGPVTAAQREDLRRLQASQRHLLGLINEVLNYAKLETGTVHFAPAPVRVRDALAGAEALVAPQAQAKGLTLTVEECGPAVVVWADAEKLRQILVNLLSNAVKFTYRGGHLALACAVDAPADDARVRIVVRDTGIGIPPDKLEAIFDPFVQVRSDLTRTAEGTGLGLAISRDLARAMGGDLTAESTLGAGSAFTLTLPRA